MNKPLRYPKVIGYELVEQIGGGGFSSVFRAVNFQEQRVAACKMITLTVKTKPFDRKMFDKEMRVHSVLKHVNVLEFLNAVVIELNGKSHYYPGIYMLLELAAGGDLFDKIAPDVGVGDEIAHFYFVQLLQGMEYIHKQGVCHRDLKPENILLDAAGVLKISDFGLSSVFRLKDSGQTRLLSERCGSLPYVAPELNSNDPYHAEPIDVWGMGVILYTLMAGNTPWDEPTERSPEFCRYLTGEIYYEAPWNGFSESALDLIAGLLTINPADRTTLFQASQHPWCIRPSQVASQGPAVLAQKLTESLRYAGDLDIATPNLTASDVRMDHDGDQIMASATHNSQFTQSLLLFSQTQAGTRYTPALTRFYCSLSPGSLMPILHESLLALNVKCKPAPETLGDRQQLRIRIGGLDRRKVVFKGWVIIETFNYGNEEGSFCVMQRDEGSPLSWRQLWKALIKSDSVESYVFRK